ncbi:MAG: polysaccharide deacetylase family protein [Planctomycetaceae bacterium]|nr:polysaccharide deacetylase family protein [Planctomycetaceae bacterium]
MSLSLCDLSRRSFLGAIAAGAGASLVRGGESTERKAQIAITLDLEMSRHYPTRGMMEWDFQKGNLDDATKRYSVEAAKITKERGGLIHFFCVGRVLEHESVEWLEEIHAGGHPIGNHTYDHVYVLAKTREEIQFRFKRSPWLIEGQEIDEVIRENIRRVELAMGQRTDIPVNGFRTPGGFAMGLEGREDIQQMLLDLGYTWASCKYPKHEYGEPMQEPSPEVYADIVRAQAEAQPFVYPTGLVEIPMSPISDVGAFRSTYWKLDYFLKAVRMGVEWAIENRAVFDFLAHPSCLVVEDPKFETIKLICDLVEQSNGQAEIVGLDAIAERVRA